MYTKVTSNIFQTIENIVSTGDKYYGKLILFSHMFNVLYIMLFSLFGISLIQNQVMRSFNTAIQMFICMLLLIKYHPFREHILAQSDSNLIFSSAVFLFFNLGLIETLSRVKQSVTVKLQPPTNENLHNITHDSNNGIEESHPQPYM